MTLPDLTHLEVRNQKAARTPKKTCPKCKMQEVVAAVKRGSGSKSASSPVDELFDVIEESLKDQGVEDYDQGTPKVNTTTPVVEQLIKDVEKDGKVKVIEYTYDAETGEFFYIVEIVVESIGSGVGSGSGSAQFAPPGFLDSPM